MDIIEAWEVARALVATANLVKGLGSPSIYMVNAAEFALLELAEQVLRQAGLPPEKTLIEYKDGTWCLPDISGMADAQP